MLVRLRRDFSNIALPMAQLGLVAVTVAADRGWGTLVGVSLLAATGLYGWLYGLRHARLILDTPTARIGSAAQGYTELRGRGQPLSGTPLLSPINYLPVLWYRVTTHKKTQGNKWVHVRTFESEDSFLLRDGSGECAIDPAGAEMLVRRRDVFNQGELRHIQWSLIRDDPVYVLGEFATLGSVQPDFNERAQVRELIAHWKSDPEKLLSRFDLDGNGELDLREWELARAQAKREVRQQLREQSRQPELHVMRKPAGRLYLISDLDPARIANRYRAWSLFHMGVFLASVAAAAWFRQIGLY